MELLGCSAQPAYRHRHLVGVDRQGLEMVEIKIVLMLALVGILLSAIHRTAARS
ncbi:hypothetical protein [Tardiphaga sp.]|uniref:hypothetical protein n=1 Tax=Tardiphaga sp. TaxID=1926292 RepID=UPI00262B917C|nr:hypothetical protein [Tardiphaga sp.]